MLYEKTREIQQLSYRRWIDEEVFSARWFLIVAVLAVIYFIWLKIGDRRRATPLLLHWASGQYSYGLPARSSGICSNTLISEKDFYDQDRATHC